MPQRDDYKTKELPTCDIILPLALQMNKHDDDIVAFCCDYNIGPYDFALDCQYREKAKRQFCERVNYLGSDGITLHWIFELTVFLMKFYSWQQLQVSACLGGFWDGEESDTKVTKDNREELKRFVLAHDYDKLNDQFVLRKKPLLEMPDAI